MADHSRQGRLRESIESEEIAVLPGCYDALSAKIVDLPSVNSTAFFTRNRIHEING